MPVLYSMGCPVGYVLGYQMGYPIGYSVSRYSMLVPWGISLGITWNPIGYHGMPIGCPHGMSHGAHHIEVFISWDPMVYPSLCHGISLGINPPMELSHVVRRHTMGQTIAWDVP